jgi:hypothetical protein
MFKKQVKFLFKGEKQSSLFTTDSNVFQRQNKTTLLSLLIADSRSFQGKRSPVVRGCFFFLIIWLGGGGGGGGESKRWDHCWWVLETAKPPLSGYQGGS